MGTITAELNFLQWQELYETERPFQIFIPIPDDAQDTRDSNLVFHPVQLDITDVHTVLEKISLDDNGFIFRKHNTDVVDFSNRAMVEKVYLPQMEALLAKELEGVDRVFFFDWRLRKNEADLEQRVIDLNDFTTWLRPATHVHVDQSPAAVLKRVRLQLKDDAEFLLRGRIRIVNIWRPLISSVEDWPLAVGDGSTFEDADLVETDHVRRYYTGTTIYVLHNPKQRYYYMDKQSKEDVLIFKNFDSKEEIKAKYAPHGSFLHPHCGERAIPRQSVEVRALVFTYPEA